MVDKANIWKYLKRLYSKIARFFKYLSDLPEKIPGFNVGVLLVLSGIFLWQVYTHIQFHAIWTDESYSIFLALHPVREIIKITACGRDAPLYFLILHYWEGLFGISELAVRSLSVLFSFGTLIISFYFSRKFLNR